MSDIVDTNLSRVIADGILARNGLVGRAYALDGSAGDPWVGAELTAQLLMDIFNSPEAVQWRDSNDPASIHDINARLNSIPGLQAQIATLQAQLAEAQKPQPTPTPKPTPTPTPTPPTPSLSLWGRIKKLIGLS